MNEIVLGFASRDWNLDRFARSARPSACAEACVQSGCERGDTLEEIGQDFDVTRERIWQLRTGRLCELMALG